MPRERVMHMNKFRFLSFSTFFKFFINVNNAKRGREAKR